MNQLAVEQIELAKTLRVEKERIDAEIAAIRRARSPKISAPAVAVQRPQGPPMANGMFVTRRCPTCGHRT